MRFVLSGENMVSWSAHIKLRLTNSLTHNHNSIQCSVHIEKICISAPSYRVAPKQGAKPDIWNII